MAVQALRMSELPQFGGSTYDGGRDGPRLLKQLHAVAIVMSEGERKTLSGLASEVSQLLGRYCSEASVSARLRDLRKEVRLGFPHVAVRRQHIANGLHMYWVPEQDAQRLETWVKVQLGRYP